MVRPSYVSCLSVDLFRITTVKYKDQNEQLTWFLKLLKPQQMALQAKGQMKFTLTLFTPGWGGGTLCPPLTRICVLPGKYTYEPVEKNLIFPNNEFGKGPRVSFIFKI